MAISKNFTKTYPAANADDHFMVTIAPCSWMYPHYRFQVSVKLASTGQSEEIVHPSMFFRDATPELVDEMVEPILTLEKCKCGNNRLANQYAGNREEQCEVCWMAEWQANCDKLVAEEKEKERVRDQTMYADGYRYAVRALIHAGSSDDYQVDFYYKEKPSTADISRQLAKEGCRQKNDYKVEELKPE